ncbi:MAG: pentapeptide repeat-containing protein [Cyanobacteria bacterium P01_G01_bin.67]
MTGDRIIDMAEGNKYEQQGNYGVGHLDDGEVKDNAKVAGHLEENNHKSSSKTYINFTVNIDSQNKSKVEENTPNNNLASGTSKFEITLSGELTKDQRAKYKGIEIEIEDLVEKLGELGIKHKLTINYVKQGSIKIGLEGHPEDFQKLQELFQSGQLNEILDIPVEDISLVVAENLDIEEKKNTEKARLIEEIKTKGARGRSLIGADLRGADLRGANLSEADLRGADLRGANLSEADLRRANLSRIRRRGFNFRSANLSKANLSKANLNGANLSAAILYESNLSETNLSLANLSLARLSRANLIKANLSEAKVEHTRFAHNKGITESLKQDLIVRGAFFKDAQEVYA